MLLVMVLLIVAPFPWVVLTMPTDPGPDGAPRAVAGPPIEPTEPAPDPQPQAAEGPSRAATVYTLTSYDRVDRTLQPMTLDPMHRQMSWPAPPPVSAYNLTFVAGDPTAPPRIDLMFIADVAAVPMAGPLSVRKSATVPQVTWTLVSAGPAPAVAAPAGFTVTVSPPAAAPQQGASSASTGAASAPVAPSPTSSAAPTAPVNVPNGGVADLFARVPPDLGARPYRFLRLLGRGVSWMAFIALRSHDRLDQETRRRIYAYLMEHPGALAGHIAEHLGVRRQTVLYHLRVLTHDGLVVSQVNGRRHYFRRDDPQRADSRHVLSPGTRSILDTLPDRPITAQELADRLGLSRRTVQWHLVRLREHGLVRGLRARAGTRYVRAPGGARHFRSV